METKQKKKPVAKVAATPEIKKDVWEYKDRTYILKNNYEPLTYTIPIKHSIKYPLIVFTVSKPSEFSKIIETGRSKSILKIK